MRNKLNVISTSIVVTSLLIGLAEFFAGTYLVLVFVFLYLAFILGRVLFSLRVKELTKAFIGLLMVESLVVSVSFYSIFSKKESQIGEMFEVVSNYQDYYHLVSKLDADENNNNPTPIISKIFYSGDIFSCNLFCLSLRTPRELKVILKPQQYKQCEGSVVCHEVEANTKINVAMAYDTEDDSVYLNFPEILSVSYSSSKEKKIVKFKHYQEFNSGPTPPKFLSESSVTLQKCIELTRNFISSPLYRIPSPQGMIFEENVNTELRFQNKRGKDIGGCLFLYKETETSIASIP